ncbi:PE-PPE domain-containing protein [Nocardia sp. NPDC059246]|uniref:PE-PPE domain-containing protein n=1 Tax=unclassified Nocardia TaxID=2637762 RepID=UPI00367CF346
MITVLTLRGTGEPIAGPANMLTNVTRLLDPAKYVIGPDIPYPASLGPANPQQDPLGCSEQQSIAEGVDLLASAIRNSPDVVGLLGYSLGAEVVSAFLERKAAGEFGDCEVAWVGLLANPRRAEGDSIDPNPQGYGINGQHGPWPDGLQVWEAANPADAITSCPPDSPLRALADTVSAFSFAALGGWTADLADKLRQNRFQPANFGWWLHPLATWQLYSTAATQMLGYLSGQTHIRDYIAGGYCQRLAEHINTTCDAWPGN